MKPANSKDKEKILKTARDKKSLTFMGRSISFNTLHRDLAGQKGLAGYIQDPKSEEHATKNTLSSKLSFKMEGEIKSFQDRQELKEYVTSKPALQEILRGTLKIPL